MEYILGLLRGVIEDESMVRIVFIGVAGGSVIAFSLAIMFLVQGFYDPVRRRVQDLVDTEGRSLRRRSEIDRTLDPLAKYLLPNKGAERSKVSEKLIHAGYRTSNALTNFYALKVLGGVTFTTIVIVALQWFPDVPRPQAVFFALLACFVGTMMPNHFLDKKMEKRQRLLRNGFPDALDLLVVCVESGLGLNAALIRVQEEIAINHPELAGELSIMNSEIRAGVNRTDALRGLYDRTGLDDIKGLVASLSQAMRFGSSIAETLRVYAEEFRDKRMQAAEEQAGKIGTKLIFPLVFCLWPAFFLVAIGPALLKVMVVFQMD